MLGVTIRYGAGERTVTTDDTQIDRNKLTKQEDNKLRRLIVEAARVKGLTRA